MKAPVNQVWVFSMIVIREGSFEALVYGAGHLTMTYCGYSSLLHITNNTNNTTEPPTQPAQCTNLRGWVHQHQPTLAHRFHNRLYNHGEGPTVFQREIGSEMQRSDGTGSLVSIVSYSPSLMIIASRTQFHIERPWGQRPFSIVS